MKWELNCGGFAHLNAIIQTRNYRRRYSEVPADAVTEVQRIAGMHIPPTWPRARMVFVGPGEDVLAGQMKQDKLPPILCVGDFVSYRSLRDGSEKAIFRHVVWIQDDFQPYFTPENEAAFQAIDWEATN